MRMSVRIGGLALQASRLAQERLLERVRAQRFRRDDEPDRTAPRGPRSRPTDVEITSED